MKKKYLLALALSIVIVPSVVSVVRADDDNERDDEKSQTISSSSSSSTITKMVTQTIILEPAKTVTSVIMEDVKLPDTDRDGIPDEKDMYPKIAAQLIVDDINLDGIDDRFEIETLQ